jgi:hypothetical protein
MKNTKLMVIVAAGFALAVGLIYATHEKVFGYGAEKDGFMGVMWGTKVDQTPNIRNTPGSTGNDDIMSFYQKPDGSNPRLCGVYLKKVVYGFYHNKFNYAQFNFESSDARSVLIRCYSTAYGYEPKVTTKITPEGSFIEATWLQDTNAWTIIKYNTISEAGTLSMLYAPVLREEFEKENTVTKKSKMQI